MLSVPGKKIVPEMKHRQFFINIVFATGGGVTILEARGLGLIPR